jgi:hypothetical protein
MMSRRKLFGWLVTAPAAAAAGAAIAASNKEAILSLRGSRSILVVVHSAIGDDDLVRFQKMIDASAQETRLKIQKDFGAMAQSYRLRHG